MTSQSPRQLRLAAICTAWYVRSHADVICQRWKRHRPTDADWGWTGPTTELASVYIEQMLDNDVGCDFCQTHGVPRYDSVDAALTGGSNNLMVDGVILIGEHGVYENNAFEQKLYPRKELFDEITATFRRTGRAVPVFCDKHYSWNFDWALEMDQTARDMGFYLFGGSSIPLCPQVPQLDLAGRPITRALTVFYHLDETYGYHSIEFAQSLLEQRRGGESGIHSITVYRGDAAWQWLDSDPLFAPAVEALDARLRDSKSPRDNVKAPLPTVAVFKHRDGLEDVHVNLTGHIKGWATALQIEGESSPRATAPQVADEELYYAHFASLAHEIEEAVHGRGLAHLPRRALLTTGMTAAMMRARQAAGTPLETPELHIAYARE